MPPIHMLHIGPNGTFEPSGDYSSKPSELNDFFSQLEYNSVTLHFHGGLVPEKNGMDTADMMAPIYRDAQTQPLSLIWETGLIETLQQNITKVHKTKLFKKLLKLVLKRATQRFGGVDAKGSGRSTNLSEIDIELSKDEPFEDFDNNISTSVFSRGNDLGVDETFSQEVMNELQAEFEEDIQDDADLEKLLNEQEQENATNDVSKRGFFSSAKIALKLAKIAYRVIKRKINGRDHGLYPTVIEEILRELYLADLGAWVWGSMKDKANSMWLPNAGRQGDELRVGSSILDFLETKQKQSPSFTINLVGHSAGSIVICQLLKAVATRHPNLRFNNLVFLAPAVRADLAVDAIVEQQELFNNFYMYTMSDEFEQQDKLVPKLYTRSLLYFISGVLEPDEVDIPIAGMMRHHSQSGPFSKGVAQKWASYTSQDGRTVLADSSIIDPSATLGNQSTSRKHGDFDNDKATQQSLTHILSQ